MVFCKLESHLDKEFVSGYLKVFLYSMENVDAETGPFLPQGHCVTKIKEDFKMMLHDTFETLTLINLGDVLFLHF